MIRKAKYDLRSMQLGGEGGYTESVVRKQGVDRKSVELASLKACPPMTHFLQ